MVDTCAAQFEVVPPHLHRSVLLMWNTLPPEMETYFQHTDLGDTHSIWKREYRGLSSTTLKRPRRCHCMNCERQTISTR